MKRRNGGLLLLVVAVAFVSACATMQDRWEAARSANTIEAYEDFLKECPEGDLADQARIRRNELYEEGDWRDAETGNTVETYRVFLKNHPQGKHRDDAHARLETLTRSQADDLPPDVVGKFLKRYRRGVFMDEALTTPENLSLEQAVIGLRIPEYGGSLNRHPSRVLADEARREQEKTNDVNPASGGEGSNIPKAVSPASGGEGSNIPKAVSPASGGEGSNIPKAVNPASAWGRIMYPKRKTNIRAGRSTASRLKGQLKTGQPVKVDFLKNAWYAAFPVTQKQRNEKMALGYVYAPFLIDKRGPDSPGSTASGKKSAGDAPLKKIETEGLPVNVRNLTFQAGGDGKELLLVEFNRFYTPAISKIEGKNPRIILKIGNASPFKKEWAAIHTGGRFIRRIRSSMDPQTREAVIVLDMAPEKDYFVNQTFYKKENMYSLEISGIK
ncbi:MAG: hypothetical protein JXL20_04775 [Deltaproteobacteria bacterium]|nr:hypothetical protein [Deltaproteobacteria bacterium]